MWTKRAPLIGVVGSMLLVSSLGLSLAQPDGGMNSSYPGYEAAAPDSQDPVEIQAAPSVSVAAPSAAEGDFGASQGDVWDMDSTNDIAWTQEGFTVEKRPEGTIVRGYIPEGEDLALAFYTSSTTNLPSGQYHHLTYRLKIAAEGSCKTNGRIVYTKNWPLWQGSQVHTHGFLPHEPPMNCAYGQFCIYYMDLSSNSNDIIGPDTATWFTNPPPWPNDPVKAFGMWPHERWANCSGGPNYFEFDYVYLTGEIVAREKDGYKYTVKWNVSDQDGGIITSELRYQQVAELRLPDNRPQCNGSNFNTGWTFITQKTTNLSPGPSYPNKIYLPVVTGGTFGGSGAYNETYDWFLSSDTEFQDGKSYYVCIRVDDGTSQSYAVSSAPVIRAPYSPNFGDQ